MADKKFDTRMVERNIQRGSLTQAELDKVLKDLPDEAANVNVVTVEALDFQERISRRS